MSRSTDQFQELLADPNFQALMYIMGYQRMNASQLMQEGEEGRRLSSELGAAAFQHSNSRILWDIWETLRPDTTRRGPAEEARDARMAAERAARIIAELSSERYLNQIRERREQETLRLMERSMVTERVERVALVQAEQIAELERSRGTERVERVALVQAEQIAELERSWGAENATASLNNAVLYATRQLVRMQDMRANQEVGSRVTVRPTPAGQNTNHPPQQL